MDEEPDFGSHAQAVAGSGCDDVRTSLPNNLPVRNEGGHSASFDPSGSIDLTSEFATPQGTNGRHCVTCHAPEDGWGLTPATAQRLFDCSDGLHPLFAARDSNRRFESDLSTVEARRENFSMVLQGKFSRRRALPPTREFDCVDSHDPIGLGDCEQLHRWRRSMPTANFRTNGGFNWHVANTLESQVDGNITGAQEGDPPTQEVIDAIVAFEIDLTHAQLIVPGVGRLDSDGARGGPEAHASQPIEVGRFDLYDAWEDHENPLRAQIFRGQELFNNPNPGGRRCSACHNAKNNGNNVNGTTFDTRTTDPDLANPDMALYTLRNRETGEERTVTDPGRAMRTGLWTDVGRMKTANIRGLASRAPYYHNGVVETLEGVVRHYEDKLGFIFTDEEREDLVAFMNAL